MKRETMKPFAGFSALAMLVIFSAATAFAAPTGGASEAEKAFDEAYAAGKPMTAERAFRQLIEANPQTAPIRYYRAAEVARDCLQTTLRADRLAHYLRVEKNWTPEARLAAWELVRKGSDIEPLVRLVKEEGAKPAVFKAVLAMADRFRNDKRPAELLKVVELGLAKFRSDDEREQLLSRAVKLRDDRVKIDGTELRRILFEHPLVKSASFRDLVRNDGGFTGAWIVEYCAKHHVMVDGDLFWGRVSKLNEYSKDHPAVQRDLVKKLMTIEDLCVSNGNSSAALTYLQVQCTLPKMFVAASADDEAVSLALCRTFGKVCQLTPRVRTESHHQYPDIRTRANNLVGVAVPKHVAALRDKYPWAFNWDRYFFYGGPYDQAKEKGDASILEQATAKSGRTEVYWERMGDCVRFGCTEPVLRKCQDDIYGRPWSFDYNRILDAMQNMKTTDERKAQILREAYLKTGYTDRWKELAAQANRFSFMNGPKMKEFLATIGPGAKGTWRMKQLAGELGGMSREGNGDAPAAAHKVMAEAVKLYGHYYPQAKEGEKVDWADRALFEGMFNKYWDLCHVTPASCGKYLETMMPVFGPGSDWGRWQHCLNRNPPGDIGAKAYWYRWNTLGEWESYRWVRVSDKDTSLPAELKNDKWVQWTFNEFINTNSREKRFGSELWYKVLVDYLVRFASEHSDNAAEKMSWLRSYCDEHKELYQKLPWDALWAQVEKKPFNGSYLREFFATARNGGVYDRYWPRYRAIFDKADAAVRVSHGIWMLHSGAFVNYDPEHPEKETFGPFVRDALLPALKSITPAEAPSVWYHDWWDPWNRLRDWAGRSKWPERDKTYYAFARELARVRALGAGGTDNAAIIGWMFTAALDAAVKAGDDHEMAMYAANTGRYYNDHWVGDRWFCNIMKDVRAKEKWEILYLMANNVPAGANQSVVTEATRYRGEAATKLPGIYPVSEKDPSYPLYVAADEFGRRNTERAWDLLSKNLAVFEREAVKLPPDFVAWGIEQMRIARGEKDALLVRARNLASQLLANEAKITPALAAAAILTRAECYRDQQNFEAARLEYQAVRNNPAYNVTPSGRKAMFRAVDLMIDVGNASGAEETIEYWLSQPDVEIQAQAHFFLARIAFDRKDYEETKKQLDKVFEIDFTHTEARFLQGKWKLATNNEVDDTDVLIGRLEDRTVIRPGQQLTVTVQDRNLSVAGGGASIPLVLYTKPGNDKERILLYPSTRDPTLFKGVIDVVLGDAVVSNRVLEVRGNDTAAYQIDPAFLRARGLATDVVKRLSVIDDGRLAIGAGAPRASEDDEEEEDDTADRLEGALTAGGAGGYGISQTLRPGNPFYIAVSDKDRSNGGKNDSVPVTITTTSGDRLENIPLKESKPFTGLFRGRIPTFLPPPRAFASDTAVGFNPGDVINSTRSGLWKSQADGKLGKWFEVDTMGSHLVTNIHLVVDGSPDEITGVSLEGALGGDAFRLGDLPAGDIEKRLGLHYQIERDAYYRSEREARDKFTSEKAPTAVSMDTFVFKPYHTSGNKPQTVRYSGAFSQPEGYDYLRLKIVALNTVGKTFDGLQLSVFIDGKSVYSGQGNAIHDHLFLVDDVPAGPHMFELIASCRYPEDAFKVMWEPMGEEAVELPVEWFDAKKHPDIREFLEDKVVITRTEDGFNAMFPKPVRLRSFRWTFTARKRPDVALQKMFVTNDKGKLVLPVESDFSDAQQNDRLEVAPGDVISVSYKDEKTVSGVTRILQKTMNSSFNNGTVGFYYEEKGERGMTMQEAYRFRPGARLILCVKDPDADVSEEVDKVKVRVKTHSGVEKTYTLVEQGEAKEDEGVHTGVFCQLLRTCLNTETNAPANVLRVAEDDTITVSYLDQENTSPGVPFNRTAKIPTVRESKPILTLFHARTVQEPDKSQAAQDRLRELRRRPGNEQLTTVYKDVLYALPMTRKMSDSTEPIPVNVVAGVPLRVNQPCRALHAGSYIRVEAVSDSELKRAEEEDRDPEVLSLKLALGGGFGAFNMKKGVQTGREARALGSFNGVIPFALGEPDPNMPESEKGKALRVNGADTVHLRVFDENDEPVIDRTLKLVSNGQIQMLDSTFTAERTFGHVGEKFFIQVTDPDRDATEDPDHIDVEVADIRGRVKRTLSLTESLPHSGVFTGFVRPVMFAPGEKIPNACTGGVASAVEIATEDRFPVRYGDGFKVSYRDELVLPGTLPRTLCTTGSVFRGADGAIRAFSKRFRDRDMAVLVQFRLAECLFEQAKEYRKLKQRERSQEAIAEGKYILEEALKNYPDSAHVVQGEFLLANLYQELAAEQKEAGETKAAQPLYTEALARFSAILSTWPEGEFAARSQYHKAICLEMLEDYPRASEEYVKMTYLFPESELVGEATVRLANHYYKHEKRYDVSGRIYDNFQRRFPQHERAAKALFMSGQCYVKMAEEIQAELEKENPRAALSPRAARNYADAVRAFTTMTEQYREQIPPVLRAQGLYWAGDISLRRADYSNAYLYLKRTVFEYPETEWARRARGLLLQESKAFEALEEE